MSNEPEPPPPPYEDQLEPGDSSSPTCPTGAVHEWSKPYYPRSAYVMAIFLFPCGILCCLKMKEVKCLKCRAEYTIGEGEEDPQKKAERDQAYRLGFAIGAVGQLARGVGGSGG
ncbi:hypothetical protein SpCBS45565_g02767 [Spizellomyces sp. 'palustris']|nr:hypothetical protein SpCBS45565_g02767 [Spizellomyces sp. 'palustris']